jgi:hypothetical protein
MNKFRRVSSYKINEKDEQGRWASEEVFYYNPTLETILELLNEGPCRVVFNSVYYKNPGIRGMTCVIPTGFPQNAFIAKHPDLIAVIDLDLQKWRSMKYGEIIILERLKQKDVSYAQRKLVANIRGQNWDYLWPGEEGDTLRPDNRDQSRKTFP